LLSNVTTDDGGSPRTYNSGMSSVIASARDAKVQFGSVRSPIIRFSAWARFALIDLISICKHW
jgi:hypothetical protein